MNLTLKRTLLTLVVGIFAITACKKNVKLEGAAAKAGKPGLLTFIASELNIKGKKFDVRFSMTNEHKSNIIIRLSDMTCAQGGTSGVLSHSFFGAGERTIDFAPNQTKNFHLVCRTYGESSGDYSITISRIFDNPSNDMKTPGKQIGGNIVWRAAGESSDESSDAKKTN